MDKRLPLFMFLCVLVLMAWMALFAPEPPERPEAADRDGQDAPAESVEAPRPNGDPEVSAGEEEPAVGEVVVASEERDTGPLIFGAGSETGRYLARFSNRGARLVELRLGDYYDRVHLDAEARDDPEHWVRLVSPVATGEDRTTGSLLLETSASSEDLARGMELDRALWEMEVLRDGGGEPIGVEFELAPGSGVRFVKRFRFVPGTHDIQLEIELHNEGAGPGSTRGFVLTPAGCVPPALDDRFYIEPKAVAAGPWGESPDSMKLVSEDKRDGARDRVGPLDAPTPLAFAGVHNKYFAFLVREAPASPTDKRTMVGAGYERVWDAEWAARNPDRARDAWKFIESEIHLELRLPEEGGSETYRYEIFAGPKDREEIVTDYEPHELLLEEDLGWFSAIGTLLLGVLGAFERVVGNWGVAIILLTVCIRGLLFPLNRRFQTSMARYQKKMKRVQPRLEEIKKRHAKDLQKQRQEQARIMQEEGAFPPLGGCLPMFVQIPIFIGLFGALRTNFDLRHAPFAAWITDLSQPDRLLELGLQIPLLVTTLDLSHLNLLPILMVVLWILQQKGMPTPADEQAARMQKMMMFMPIVMGVFLYNYAAGLSLYMITQSGLGIFEQKFIKKHWPIDDTEVEKKKPGCGPFSGMMQNLAEKQREQMKRMEAMQQSRPPGQRRGGKGGKGKRRR